MSFPGRARHVGQHIRDAVHRHDLRREPRAGARLHRRRLSAGLPLTEDDIQRDVERRRSGTSKYTSQRREPDRVRILSGVFEGRTTGTPIGLLVENTDQRSYDYEKIKDRFRPGPRRLHLPAEVRLPRLPRRRPFVGARDRDARCGRRHRAQVPGREGHRHLRLPRADGRAAAAAAWTARRSTRTRSSVPSPRACRNSRR